MRYNHHVYFFIMLLAGLLICTPSWAMTNSSKDSLSSKERHVVPARNVELPAFFSDNMVVQRFRYIPVWGTASPGGEIQVVIGQDKQRTIVDEEGNWRVAMNPLPTGGPYTLEVIGEETKTFKNVMSGEVWVASGQSNMQMPLAGWGEIKNYKQEIAAANYPDIRLLQVKRALSPVPLEDVEVDGAQWRQTSPETIPGFSAVAYFFGRNLYKKLKVPIGLIHTSWGGTPAEAWTSGPSLKAMPAFADAIEELEQRPESQEALRAVYRKEMQAWQQQVMQKDPGYTGGKAVWALPDYDTSSWKAMTLPGNWEEAGLPDFDGVVWFRKTIQLSQEWEGSEATLNLGPVDDRDITWINGEEAGRTQGWNVPRSYNIPAGLLKPGKNTITVRVLDTGGGGGLTGKPEQLSLSTSTGNKIDLDGSWQYKVAIDLREIPPMPESPNLSKNYSSVLYNAMLHPLIPYAMRGVIWYQGEANASRAYQYRELFPLMIKDWRQNWGQGHFPFLYVQLANFKAVEEEPVESDWAELREAQLMALARPNTGMAVTIDIGNANDIHPKNKQDVGRRLALIARAKVYGEQIPYSGPIYRSMNKFEGNKIRLSFKHIDGGLQAKGSKALKGFAVAGPDRIFHWAEAEIIGNQVLVWSPKVSNPVAVRYGWAANPAGNLYNGAGLPASPFRTDDWEGVTEGRK